MGEKYKNAVNAKTPLNRLG